MTAELAFFALFALGAIGGSLGVIVFRNPVNSAVSLVGSFFFLAGIYVLLNAHFLAILQILVYAGAIMVLFIFVLMLLNIRDDELGKAQVNVTKLLAPLFALGLAGLMMLVYAGSPTAREAIFAPSLPESYGTLEPIGRELMTTYVLPFEMASVLLLVGIVGAVVVAKRRL